MNKGDLVKSIASKQKLTVAESEKVVNGMIEAISNELKKKGKVTLVGFGTFKVMDRKARTGVNPKTGQRMQIKAKRVPKFIAGKALKNKVK